MPEVGDPTPSEHDSVNIERSSMISVKRYTERGQRLERVRDLKESVVFSRGKELPKAGMITGVKS